ncbi:peroxiredoxin [Terrihabitans rhizophilus]|jgi:peroxiredoxin|uniref:Glutathione-dependent peroxiredoxin n=1 Tax=Terrihabitans rhizophilus TaxID=3092662 RepID=A0ABU4RTC2_9HYPH|nr:peroxiredoxin [Terrihabitans sp. PJ23]MDX6807324.1 peroxiredoxin [Terrihabitans sp. PJ23]
MTIQIGDKIPEATFTVMGPDGPAKKTTADVFGTGKVVLFAVPGAFTPTCHKNHMPSYIEKFDELKAKGVDKVVVTSVNDVFVQDAWMKASGAEGKVEAIADGSGDFAKALGLDIDLGAAGLGVRSKRYAMIVENGVVKWFDVEDAPPKADKTKAEHVLAQL